MYPPTPEQLATEIERVFLVDIDLITPDALDRSGARSEAVRQGYLAIGANNEEVRLRDKAGTYSLTWKKGTGRDRSELEIEVTRAQFETLWPGTQGARLEKRRYTSAFGSLQIEVDYFQGRLAGLVLAEVEFPDAGSAEAFEPPAWFLDEVTEDSRFRNRHLAALEAPPSPRGP
jgi:CYTH domain-containing protein